MTAVEISLPIYIKFDFLESQEPSYSSMLMKVLFEFNHHNTTIKQDSNLYFHFSDWDLFLKRLKSERSATLHDLSNGFSLIVAPGDEGYKFEISYKEKDSYICRYLVKYNTEIDIETLDLLISKLEEFDKWW